MKKGRRRPWNKPLAESRGHPRPVSGLLTGTGIDFMLLCIILTELKVAGKAGQAISWPKYAVFA
jgi:hypothetical protein